jgi:hypothetical protein
MFRAFNAENQRGDRKTQTHRPSYTKQPTLKKICANLRHLRIKNVCYQFAPSALKTKEATGKRKHTGLPTPSSLLSKKSAQICDICG